MTTTEQPPQRTSAGTPPARWTCPTCGQIDDASSLACVLVPIEQARTTWPALAAHHPDFHGHRAHVRLCGDCAAVTIPASDPDHAGPIPQAALVTTDHPRVKEADTPQAPHVARNKDRRQVIRLPIAAIRPSSLNPRKRFDADALAELAESIRTHGLLEPLVVRQIARRPLTDADSGETHELVAGERRWRACQIADVADADVTDLGPLSDAEALELALVENVARHDLDPIEEAEGFRQLNRIAGLTQAEIANRTGREQPAIAKMIGLLDLPAEVQELIRTGQLTVGHGVALRKYHGFPAVCSAIAAWAVEHQTTTKALESKKLLDDYHLRQQIEGQGVAIDIPYGVAFDTAICNNCPYGAYRSTSYGHGLCLKPEHYQTLETAARALKEAKAKEALDKAQQEGKALPTLDSLPWAAYERINSSAPAGCTPDCPCRGQALNRDGAAVAICTDTTRWQTLATAAHRAQTRQRKERYAQQMAALKARLQVQPEIDTRGLALLVAEALRGNDSAKAAVAREMIAWLGLDLDAQKMTAWHLDYGILAQLATLPAPTLVTLAIGTMLGAELKRTSDGYGSADRHTWYTAPAADQEQAAQPSAAAHRRFDGGTAPWRGVRTEDLR